MKSLALLLLMVVGMSATSIAQQTAKQSQLVGKRWVVKTLAANDKHPQLDEVYQFMADGTYTMTAGPMTFIGDWKWNGNDEIVVELSGMLMNGNIDEFDKPSITHIRVVDFNANKLATRERAEGNTWTDGFVVERYYAAM